MSHQYFFNRYVKLILTLAGITVISTSCEKDVNYVKPPGNTDNFQKDISETMTLLSGGDSKSWTMDNGVRLPAPLAGYAFTFSADRTANIRSVMPVGIVRDLIALQNSGAYSQADRNFIGQVASVFSTYPDSQLRNLLEEPGNAGLKDILLELLPNYYYFNGLSYDTIEPKTDFIVNGPVQLSLLFPNSQALANLKQQGVFDFDFRVKYAGPDSIALDGYFTNNKNKVFSLLPVLKSSSAKEFAGLSSLILRAGPTRFRAALRLGGISVPVDPGFASGLHFFYAAYGQVLDRQLNDYGFILTGAVGDAKIPAELKTVRLLTAKSFYAGIPLQAPSGTVLATLTAHKYDGSTEELEIVK